MILVTGHSRSGTLYAARLLWAFGYEVGHERLGPDGISAWQLAVEAPADVEIPWRCPPRPDGIELTIQMVRDPYKAIPSIAYTDGGGISMDYRARFIDLPEGIPELERAALSLVRWNRLVTPDLVVRLESAEETLSEFFHEKPTQKIGVVNSRPHPHYPPARVLRGFSDSTLAELREYCERYGYSTEPIEAAA